MNKSTINAAEPVPTIFNLFPYQANPHVERARAHLVDWTRRKGLVYRQAAMKRLERADFGGFAALVYPTANSSHLNLMADWFAWLFLIDDQLDDGNVGRNPRRARQVVDGMRAALQSPGLGAALARDPDVPVAVSSLADLWSRTATNATAHWRRRFVQHLWDCLSTAATWEAVNRVNGVVPDEQTYIAKRRHTGAIYVCMDLIDIVEQIDIPEPIYHSPRFTAALHAACNVVCWTNDVYSLEKERSLGEVHNLVHIVQRHRNLTEEKALSHVRTAISAEAELFLTGEEELLRTYSKHTGVLARCLAGMRAWMRGNLDWSSHTKRYHPSGHADTARPEVYLESTLLSGDC